MNNTYNIFSAWRFDLNKEIQWSIFSKDVSASSYDKAMYKAVGENQEHILHYTGPVGNYNYPAHRRLYIDCNTQQMFMAVKLIFFFANKKSST
jgi:hypothetical protein